MTTTDLIELVHARRSASSVAARERLGAWIRETEWDGRLVEHDAYTFGEPALRGNGECRLNGGPWATVDEITEQIGKIDVSYVIRQAEPEWSNVQVGVVRGEALLLALPLNKAAEDRCSALHLVALALHERIEDIENLVALDPPEEADRLLTPQEVSDLLRVSLRTVEGWRLKGGGGPNWVRVGQGRRSVRYPLTELRRYLAERTEGVPPV